MLEILLEQVKRKCNITWKDDETDQRLKEIINSAIPDLAHKLGITDENFDFSEAGVENTLLLAYCFYEWNHCLNEFEDNYSKLIAQVQDKRVVEKFLSEGKANEE